MPHALRIPQAGGPEVFELVDVERPAPGPGQLLVRLAAVGVNFIETYQRSGVYPVQYPFVPGTEGSGTVEAVGEGVTDHAVGDRVATSEGTGSYAEYMLVDAEKAFPVPEGVSDEVAGALPLQGFTAHYLINNSFKVGPGDTVLTYAGAGGVGQLLIQLLKLRGATVITTTSTEEKAELARAAGADHVLSYAEVPDRVRELTDGRGVDVVYDGIGKDTFEGSLASLRIRGTLVLFGGASGQVPPFDLQRLNSHGSLTVTRPKLSDFLLDGPERRWRAQEMFSLVAEGTLKVAIGARFPLEQAGQAHTALASRATTGKVILLPDSSNANA
ncbi:MAG: quinone oxidoreductase family protein [Arthrobacter sp.]|uniref:quinone oxidoreductase family protein n=1 Tax=unclassified Arthrobacter TaxID=235627 RepID=UPI002655D86B|nr:quinone oxidoreductase [Micrococcaceae bacterium]MDN5811805.1 quinone oxidoreductase [Micrococcaceae bacterium]MDN5822762.1 quinone oxidoreductase [Micrococcaceae bacterium]MDN5878043.1 quinone oxidoreductase [Micrococcaceae bacterium]MDN5885962.1 quinone oxidoreductase [Micrococcaceae bacterium]